VGPIAAILAYRRQTRARRGRSNVRLSDLTRAERAVFLWFTLAVVLLPPAGAMLLVLGDGTVRVIGAALLAAALLHMAVPTGAILTARARKRLQSSVAGDPEPTEEPSG
jgi:hypothetical protein